MQIEIEAEPLNNEMSNQENKEVNEGLKDPRLALREKQLKKPVVNSKAG